MVNRQVSIFLAVAVLANACFMPSVVRADPITPIDLADPPGALLITPIGSRGSLERSTPRAETVASGKDALGDPWLVQLGIEQLYAAEYTKTGISDDDVLSALSDILNTNGLPATEDPLLNVLSLDNPISVGAELDAVASETSSLELLGIGFVLMVLILRRRSTK